MNTREIYEKFHLDDNIPGCTNFYWREALWCPKWNVFVFPTDIEAANIVEVAQKMERIRTYFQGKEITILSWLRPKAYNDLIGGAKLSEHMLGKAVDFLVKGISPDKVREELEPLLDQLEIRMEKLPGSSWTHIDTGVVPPKGHRYFVP